jgi:tetratricopeptide (TPR) repeat protein
MMRWHMSGDPNNPSWFRGMIQRAMGFGTEPWVTRMIHWPCRVESPAQAPWLPAHDVRIVLVCLIIFASRAHAQLEPAPPASPSSPVARRSPSRSSAEAKPSEAELTAAQLQDRALREEQLRQARQLEQDFPQSGHARSVLGLIYNEQGDSTAAIECWQAAIRASTNPLSPAQKAEAYYNWGYALLLREEYEPAVRMLKESLQLNPRSQEAHYRLAHAFFLQGKMEECLSALEAGHISTALGYRLRGQACQHLGRLAEARQHYESALKINPDLAEAYYGLGMTLSRLGETNAAEERLKQFETLKTQNQAMGRQRRSDHDSLAITQTSLAKTHTEIGRIYFEAGRRMQAETLWKRAAELDSNNTLCRFQLMMIYQQSQRNQEAIALCQQMIQAEPRNGYHHLALGNLYLRLNQLPEAEAAFKRVMELEPKRSEGYFALAQLYLRTRSHVAEACRLAQQAVQLSPMAPNYYVLSMACSLNQDSAGALAAISRACELDPANPQYRELRQALAKGGTQ